MWVIAMDVYGRVARGIEPKKAKLAEAEKMLADAEHQLAAKKAVLKEVEDRVEGLRAKLSQAKQKAQQLEKDMEIATIKLGRAEKLLAGLGNEAVRWKAASEQLEQNLKDIVGNVVLGGGFVAYLGPFTADFREKLTEKWIQECLGEEVQLAVDSRWSCDAVLGDPAQIREWNIQGLPDDKLSVENGIIVSRGRRWPLMIDPQGQANKWIRNLGKEKDIQVIKLTDATYLRTLENGIRNGNAVLLENVEEVLDPALEPVLSKQVFKKGGQSLIRLGTEDVPYSHDFAFYITTKMPNPHYLPEICIKVTIINFTVTPSGLESQLVSEVVAHERPDLEQKRGELVVQIAADKNELNRIEQLILKLLAENEGDILADDTLIQTLD
ncbi:hypothetical protein FOZ62_006067, partial [Perkinsus olseni]